MKKTFLALFFVFPFAVTSIANDTAGTILPTGGIVFEKQDGIKMKVEALYIRPYQIEVNYLFENTTNQDITTQVFFPLPEMPAVEEYLGDESHDYKFKLWVNGKQKQYQTHWTITKNDKDITKEVAILFYRPEEVITDQELSKRIAILPEETRKSLEDNKIIAWDWTLDRDSGEIQSWIMGEHVAWQKQISYSWEQNFPAHKTVSVRHTYTPTAIYNSVGAPFSKCVYDKSDPYKSFAYIAENENTYSADHLQARNYLEYILTTANNWQGPIESFNLIVQSPFKSVGCFDGEAFYGEEYYAVNRQNYTPQWDLSAEFLVKGELYIHKTKQTTPTLYRIDGPANLRDKPNGKVIAQLADKTYVWVWPKEKEGKWYPVMQNQITGYTHKQNLIKVF
ncbi:MAG: DUF4424 family protein [Elusimicrobiaceae bacterium]|nr:DUF4424 family protein [Elusimicrobiaceae bacterium]